MPESKKQYLPFLMWAIALSFFTFQFILRLWPGLMMNQIMSQYDIDVGDFGIIAAFYYYGYAGMQIPLAIFLERFGSRFILTLFATICGLATIAFTYTDNYYIAVLSRFFVGIGSAAGFLTLSKVISEWFPLQYTKMIGLSFSIGLMGAIYGGKPLGILLENHNWRDVSYALGAISILIGVISYFTLHSPNIKKNTEVRQILKLSDIKSVLSSKILWLIALSNLLMVGALEGFADVWGVSYLTTAYNLAKADAAGLTSLIFFGMLFGGPLLAFFAKKFGNYYVISFCALSITLSISLILLNLSSNVIWLSILFFIIGINCCYQVLIFALGEKLVESKNLGICIAFLNSVNMMGGCFFHTIIGKTINIFDNSTTNLQGLKIYSLEAYQYALAVVPACALAGGIIILLVNYLNYKKI